MRLAILVVLGLVVASTAIARADDAPYNKFDADGDGAPDPGLQEEYEAALAGVKTKLESEIAARDPDAELRPSITVDAFRRIVRVVKKVVLRRMEAKLAAKTERRLTWFAEGVFAFALLGPLLLFVPLFVRKRYPGKGRILFKYSAIAAATFTGMVLMFGTVLVGMRAAQAALGAAANPSLAIAGGTFDTLDRNAEDYIVMGKELFVPTLVQLEEHSEDQPPVLILQNGQKLIKNGTTVFGNIASMFKKLDFALDAMPLILFVVTMILFVRAIRPTLVEIVKLPVRAAGGEDGVARAVTRKALLHVWAELRATIATIVVLAALTLMSGFALGQVVGPAIDALLGYFSLAVSYLQFVEDATTGLVFVALFDVILFLALCLASQIVSMSFFLSKAQRIFQQRFSDHVPLGTHKRFWRWGIPSVVLVQTLPWVFAFAAAKVIKALNAAFIGGELDADRVAWGKLLLAGPTFLVVGFAIVFWAARGWKAIRFIQRYKVDAPKNA